MFFCGRMRAYCVWECKWLFVEVIIAYFKEYKLFALTWQGSLSTTGILNFVPTELGCELKIPEDME